MLRRIWSRPALPVRQPAVRGTSRTRKRCDLEQLEPRTVMAADSVIFPTEYAFTQEDLRPLDVIKSRNGTLEANVRMISAGFDSNPILYGGQEIYSGKVVDSDTGEETISYAMAYQFDAYGTSYSAGFPGTMLQIDSGDTLKLHLTNELAGDNDPSDPVFTTNFHYHGSHAPDLSQADNVYVQIKPGETVDVVIPISTYENSVGYNWYHPHVHEVTTQQVGGGLAGAIMVGNPLDPWPQYKDTLTQVNMTISEVNITEDGFMSRLKTTVAGTDYTTGWQKRINGQMNPIIRIRPGETQVWNMGQFGARGATNFVIADDNLQNPWSATILSRDGASAFVHPYTVELGASEPRMNDIAALTVLSPGNRMSMAVTAPTTPGTYYFMDGWGGEEARANLDGTGYYYVLATLVVEGDVVTTDPPVFAAQPADPLWKATPDFTRTFSLEQLPQVEGGTVNIDHFYVNGKKFGEGVMPQLEIGTVEEWTILNAGPLNHPFHIHQGIFIVTKINGFPIEPDKKFPDANAANYVSPLDVIMVPAFGSVTVRFRVLDFPGKYVFHCHILEHEDEGMMSPVFQFGNTEGLRLGLGTSSSSTLVLNGQGNTVGTIRAFPNYRGPVVTASGIGTSTEGKQAPPLGGTADEINAFFKTQITKETMAFGTGARASLVKVYENGALEPTATFRAFAGKAGVGGVSLAVGALGELGTVNIVVGSRAAGPANVRLFDTKGSLLREFLGVLPGRFPHGVNVAVGDVDADNYDDVIVSAGAGREPIITALSGRDIVNGVADPARCFTFVAPGGTRDGVKVAVGFLAASTVPSYKPNLITTPETGKHVGTVSVWNVADICDCSTHGSHAMSGMSGMAGMAAMEDPAVPMATFRPFGSRRGAVKLAATYQRQFGGQAQAVVAAWQTPREVAFTAIGLDNQPQTVQRRL